MNKNVYYRKIPKVDILLEDERIRQMIETYSKDTVMESIHIETDRLRTFIRRLWRTKKRLRKGSGD